MARKSTASDAAKDSSDPVYAAQLKVAEILGDIAEFWGFTKTMGRIFGFVYMSPRALDQSTVRNGLGISAGSASTTMTALLEWGVLHREGRLYVAETNFFKLITAVLRQREAARIDDAIERARAVVEELRQAHESTQDPRIAFALQRGEHMLGFFELGRSFLEAFVERSPVRAILNGLARKASKLRPAPLPGRSFDEPEDESATDQDTLS